MKGGTALNLFILRHPRLSIDIDLNYVCALEREEMLADRPKIEGEINASILTSEPSRFSHGRYSMSDATGACLDGDFTQFGKEC